MSNRHAASLPTHILESLGMLFRDSPEPDVRSAEELYIAGGRDLSYPVKNKEWLQNRLTPLRKLGLVTSINVGPKRVLKAVKLTAKGKQALQPPTEAPAKVVAQTAEVLPANHTQAPPSLDDIAWSIDLARDLNPHLNIVFYIETRKGVKPAASK